MERSLILVVVAVFAACVTGCVPTPTSVASNATRAANTSPPLTLSSNPPATTEVRVTETPIRPTVAHTAGATAPAPVSPAPSVTPTIDVLQYANSWSVFQSKLHKLSFEYPRIYDSMPLCIPKEGNLGVTVGSRTSMMFLESQGRPLDQFTDALLQSQSWTIESQDNILVDGRPAVSIFYRFGGLNRGGLLTLLEQNGRVLAIETTAGNNDCDVVEIGVYETGAYDQIIKTLRFID